MKKTLYTILSIGGLVLSVILILPVTVTSVVTVVLGGGEEEEGGNSGDDSVSVSVSLLLSEEVEAYRSQVLKETEKHQMEAYIDLFLAVMQQESGGNGNDVFQASESKGLPPNTLSTAESIKQGVAYLSAMIKKAGCTSPGDILHIKLALQGYNFGGGYIDYAIKKDGKWTQQNTFSFAKKKSGGKRNSGIRAEQLGPWRYGDQYYTTHVLRYYSMASGSSSEESAGDPVKIPVAERMKWLFPNGIPKTELDMQPYLTQIEVSIYTTKKQKSKMILTVHKKLAQEITAVFEEMAKLKFPINPACTAGYNWRNMASNKNRQSYHSYGSVVDVNWEHNGATYTGWPYKPGKDKLAVTKKVVAVWKKHGFYWGGDWSAAYFDPMHFTYTNN